MIKLYDIYGALLTERQQNCMELYFCDDLSLAEIADELDVSRQAVHDLIHRVEQILEKYEDKLKLLDKEEQNRQLLVAAKNLLDEYIAVKSDERLEELKALFNSFDGEGR